MKMKKTILAAALATAMVASLGTTAFAADTEANQTSPKTTTLTYAVTESYKWSVPAKIDFGKDADLNSTVTRTTASETASEPNKVAVTENIIAEGCKLVIKIAAEQSFVITTGTNTTLNYTVSTIGDENKTTPLSAASEVLTVPAGTNSGETKLEFELDTGAANAKTAGEYKGTLSYTAEVVTPNKDN